MVNSKDEYIAASIRGQITALQQLLRELEEAAIDEQFLLPKIRVIETKLRTLRQSLTQAVI